VLAGCERLEAVLNEVVSLGVTGDGADFLAVDPLAGVQVADAGRSHCAAAGELALQAHFDLLAISAGTMGVHPGYNGVEEHSVLVVADALQRGLQLAAVVLDLPPQPEGVELVARDAREVVEDDIGWP
jgi:hypothetical protein